MPKLTKLFISSIKPPEKGQIFFRDSSLIGLGLRVTPSSCCYIVEARVNGVLRRITLGKESQLTPTAARKKAQKLLANMAAGKDPTIEKAKRKIRGATLQEVLDHFLSVRILKPNTVRTPSVSTWSKTIPIESLVYASEKETSWKSQGC